MSFDERFGMLVDAEWTSRQNKYLANLVKKAGMRYNARIEEVIYKQDRNLDRQMMIQLSTCTWIAERLDVIITGPLERGKHSLDVFWVTAPVGITIKSYISVFQGYSRIWQYPKETEHTTS